MPIDQITDGTDIRALNPAGVAAIKKKMEVLGFHPQFPLLVTAKAEGGSYRLLDGAHRLEAARQAGLTDVYVLLHETCEDFLEEVTLARASNEASGTMVATTLIDDAALIWRLTDAGYTQAQIGEALGGWSQRAVSDYVALRKICAEAWDIISATFGHLAHLSTETAALESSATALSPDPFTERLLRDIVDLTPAQQLELCTALANRTIKKKKFTDNARAYKARNAATAWVRKQLQALDTDFLDEALTGVAGGHYDEEWQQTKGAGPKLHKLVDATRERWERKYSIRLIHGDFYDKITTLDDASIDAIIVDPSYNLSTDRVYSFGPTRALSKNFGEWDKKEDAEFMQDLLTWAREYFRVMKPGTTGFMFVADVFLNIAQAIFQHAGFEMKETFYWCRTNPGPSVTKADLMPALELALQFVKPGASRTFHYPGDEDGEGLNWHGFPICSGKERVVDAKKDILHPTQKPEAVIQHLMEMITVAGDMVLDGFMGVGTTPAVAKRLNRKCIGIEQDAVYFAAAQQRVEA
jgi:DNA modification methylase